MGHFRTAFDAGPDNPVVTPGFGAPVPTNFMATVEEYRQWLIAELQRLDGPFDIVGHDWGGGHVLNVAMTRPDLLRSRVVDAMGVLDTDYSWHELAQLWVQPGIGEEVVAHMFVDAPLDERAALLEQSGVPREVALEVAKGHTATMADCILRLYRDAAEPTLARLGGALERASVCPGLSILPTDDHYTGTDEQCLRASRRAGARVRRLEGLEHWWFAQDPEASAKVLNDFWAQLT